MCEDQCVRGLYGARLWVPFSLYLCLSFVVFVLQLIAFDNGVSSFISLSECQKTAPYYKTLPLYATVPGFNATTNVSSSDRRAASWGRCRTSTTTTATTRSS